MFFLSKFVPSMTFNMYWFTSFYQFTQDRALLGGWLSDRLLGDPEGWPHPIVWFGKAISAGEKALNKGSERVLKRRHTSSRAYPWRVFNLRVDIVVGLDHTSAVQWVADGCRRILLPIRKDAYQRK